MAKIPTVENPSLVTAVGGSSVMVAANSIYGGPDNDDKIAEIRFKLKKNNEPEVEAVYTMDDENSSIVSHVFTASVDIDDEFIWSIEVVSNYGAKTIVGGSKTQRLVITADANVLIAHLSSVLGLIFAKNYQGVINTENLKQRDGIINTEAAQETDYIISMGNQY